MTLSELILQNENIPKIAKKKHGNSKELTTQELVSALLHTNSGPEAAKYLGIGEQTLNRTINSVLVPIFGKRTGGSNTWKYVLLKSIDYKHCNNCNTIKPYSKFGLDNTKSDKKFRICKYCRSFTNASLYQNRKLRIPSWFEQEKEKIAEFYDNCPEGYHVDHIIPLQGKYVSGLHTLNNLQYLPAEENIAKGNKYCPSGEIW